MNNLQWRTSPRIFAAVGALLAVVSSFLPWFKVASLNEVNRITPSTAPYIRASAWLACILLVVGAFLVVIKGTPLIAGCVGALWFNVSLVTWFLGSKTSSVFPKGLLPEGLTVRLQPGADVGLAASMLLLVASWMLLADGTWHGRQVRVADWRVPAGVLVCVSLIAVREVAWTRLGTGNFRWDLTLDAIPFLGDFLLVLLVVGAVLALTTAFTERLWMIIVGGVVGLVSALLALLAWLVQDTLMDIGDWAAGRAPFLRDQSVDLSASPGPFFTIAAGLGLASYSAALAYRLIHRDSHGAIGVLVTPDAYAPEGPQDFPF